MTQPSVDAHYLMRGIADLCARAEAPNKPLEQTILKAILLGIEMGLADPETSRRLRDASLMGDGTLVATTAIEQMMAGLRDYFASQKTGKAAS